MILIDLIRGIINVLCCFRFLVMREKMAFRRGKRRIVVLALGFVVRGILMDYLDYLLLAN
jgi:hypothetical protein